MSDEECRPALPAASPATAAAALAAQPSRAAAAAAATAGAAEGGEVDIDLSEDITNALDNIGLSDEATAVPTGKMRFVNPSPEEAKFLLDVLRSALTEGSGEAVVELGVGDGEKSGLSKEDMAASLVTLAKLANECGADVSPFRVRQEEQGDAGDFLVRRRTDGDDFIEVRVAVVGNVDAGKSTLLGVLTHCELDNGRGKCRTKLFRHKHEADTGRTSCVSHNILGFDSKGAVINSPSHDGNLDWTDICTNSSKVITFIDLAGHEKYLKTTVFGLTGHAPQFAMLMVGSNMGVVGMTREHLGLTLALNVPVFIVVTKIDICPPNVLEETITLLQKILKSPGCRKMPLLVSSEDDVIVTAANFVSDRLCPIFQVSNVTGAGLPLLRMFLNLLNPRTPLNADAPAEFQIDETYTVPGVGTVVSGTCLAGTIRLNDNLLLGPDSTGQFIPMQIKGVHRRRMPVTAVRGGQTASFALKKIKRSAIRKGMVLIAPALQPRATWEFDGDILILHHPTTITCKYQAMVHCGAIRQTASIVHMEREQLRTGDKTIARFRFVKNPEYLREGTRMVFREGRTKAVGVVTRIHPPEKAEK